jgi:hypothetical protein
VGNDVCCGEMASIVDMLDLLRTNREARAHRLSWWVEADRAAVRVAADLRSRRDDMMWRSFDVSLHTHSAVRK